MNLSRLHDISLKWKLLIPFLFLASAGATALFVVSYRFQADLIHLNEEKRLINKYRYFLSAIESEKEEVLSLAYMVAKNPVVAQAFAERDRQRLMEILRPGYETLRNTQGIKQIHFHTPPATSFLRLHLPERYGDEMQTYRETINLVRSTGRGVGGLERGFTGFGVRGVVPVIYQGGQVGTVEVGASFGQPFLEQFKKDYSADVTIYIPGEPFPAGPAVFASTTKEHPFPFKRFNQVLTGEAPVFYKAKWSDSDVAVIAAPVRDFSSRTVAVVEIGVDRTQTLALLREYHATAVAVGLAGLVLSISFVWLVSVIYSRRIERVAEAAQGIANGHRDTRITLKDRDELGVMANAINEMLTSLDESRQKIKHYAENLELMVDLRTRSLKESEQTYRTLVEHVPLVVYFVMSDGTVTFLNRFVEELIGVAPQELSGDWEAWTEHIHPHDRSRVLTHFQECLSQGKEFYTEYRVVHKDGHIVYVVDHAVPVVNDGNDVIRMDGIVFDVTARKELQRKILQAEEHQTLSEVSARLAHEIRNPLTSIGGLTRRLLKSFEGEDPRRKKGELIVEEVEKLEKILRMMTAYIEPRSLRLRPCSLNTVVTKAVEAVNSTLQSESFSVQTFLDEGLHEIKLDCDLFDKILINLMENAFYRMGEKGEIHVATGQHDEYATVTLTYRVPYISDDDIEHFFYPFITEYPFPRAVPDRDIMDVPICRVLIHKHGGIVSVSKENENMVRITISLPAG